MTPMCDAGLSVGIGKGYDLVASSTGKDIMLIDNTAVSLPLHLCSLYDYICCL